MPRVNFIGDMGDTLSRAVPFEYLKSEIIDVVTSPKGRRHIWMWLTKQPQRMAAFSSWLRCKGVEWPANLWPGCSVTTQATVARVGHLLRVGDENTVRFVSAEPLLGPVDFGWHFARYRSLASGLRYANAGAAGDHEVLPCVDLVIVGEESGAGRRRWDLAWPRSILAQCRAAGCAFFCKQMDVGGRVTEDVSRFPEDLRVREFPQPREVTRA
jgi:protein gp37